MMPTLLLGAVSTIYQADPDPNSGWSGVDSLAVLLTAVGASVGAYIGAYLKSKAENLARKEDLSELKRIEENISSQFQQLRDLRLVAAEKRLQAHQEAYAHVIDANLFMYLKDDEYQKGLQRLHEWWNQHCLYLSQEAWDAVFDVYSAVVMHRQHQIMLSGPCTAEQRRKAIEGTLEAARIVRAAATRIVGSVSLPTLKVMLPSNEPSAEKKPGNPMP